MFRLIMQILTTSHGRANHEPQDQRKAGSSGRAPDLMTRTALAFAALVAAFLIPATAAAQAIACANSEFARADLEARHDGVVFRGLSKAAVPTVAEIWLAIEAGVWTLSLTTPRGETCIFLVGEFAELPVVERKLKGSAWTPTKLNR